MIEAVLGLSTSTSEPAQPRPESAQPRPEPAERIDDARGGRVVLHGLLAIATLTPAQAALLVTDVVDQLELVRSRDGYPIIRDHGVTVSERGQLTIECTGSAASWHDMDEAVASLLRSIATSCRDRALADRLDESIARTTDLADLAQRVRGAVATELDPSTVGRTRCQLAELVSATRGLAHSDDRVVTDRANSQGPPTPPTPAAASSLAPKGWYPPVENPWHRKRRRLSRRGGVLGLISILLFVGVVWAAPGAWSELRRGWDALLHPVNPSEQNQISPVSPPPPLAPEAAQANSPTAQGTAEAGPVHTGLPGSAGPITLVTATFANGECATGQPCTMRVDVHVDPAANVGAVTWHVVVYDRCSGAVHPGTDVTTPVPPGGQQVYGIARVVLPPAPALAVAALTNAPAAAASEPAFVPAENAKC
ncbi:hypothetical protein [Rhodococcus maanshanensis]|uniref:Uncharacterized protein n=1 Tax=Rhodococcus maanshanensis TaxID=183556 RepID=A0A1H7TLP8_9NOCA|nr:hypothetical protein [Rhodococcus maanshanensis]SEL85802.1 hypothetical protein SAMN05444583_11612 [Rhodococcus maanshanensis]